MEICFNIEVSYVKWTPIVCSPTSVSICVSVLNDYGHKKRFLSKKDVKCWCPPNHCALKSHTIHWIIAICKNQGYYTPCILIQNIFCHIFNAVTLPWKMFVSIFNMFCQMMYLCPLPLLKRTHCFWLHKSNSCTSFFVSILVSFLCSWPGVLGNRIRYGMILKSYDWWWLK